MSIREGKSINFANIRCASFTPPLIFDTFFCHLYTLFYTSVSFGFLYFLVNFSKFLNKLFIQGILWALDTAKVFTLIQFARRKLVRTLKNYEENYHQLKFIRSH